MNGETQEDTIVWSTLGLSSELLASRLQMLPPPSLGRLRVLDISRNALERLPDAVGALRCLTDLDVSRNRLMELPASLAACTELVRVHAHANHLRPAARSLPADLLSSWPKVELLDVR